MKKRLATITALVLAAVMALSACGSSAPAAPAAPAEGEAEAITLRLGHVVADGNSLDKGLDKFAELVGEKSGGSITIEVYPNSELGDNTAMAEQLQLGTLDIMAPSTAALSGFSSAMTVLDMPYLFKNEAAAEETLDGQIGADLGAAFEDAGFHVVGYMTQGWRNLTCNKEVTKPEDLKGIKIRVMDSQYHIQAWNTLGASATPMAMSEVYTALQQGTIDAQENPYTNIVNSRFYEVQDYVVETQHVYDTDPIIFATLTWAKLTDEQKAIIEEAAKEACAWERAEVISDNDGNKKAITESGTTIVELTDEQRAAFKDAEQVVYEAFYKAADGNEDLVKMIEEINAKH